MRRSFDLLRSPNFLITASKLSVSDSPAGIFDGDDFVISIIIIFTEPGELRVGLRDQFKFVTPVACPVREPPSFVTVKFLPSLNSLMHYASTSCLSAANL
jgi:hypothetical protein